MPCHKGDVMLSEGR